MKAVIRCLNIGQEDVSSAPGGNRLEELLCGHVILNNVHQVKTLLKYGVDPNSQDEQGNSPLHVLAGKARIHTQCHDIEQSDEVLTEICRLLVYHGADIDSRNHMQLTPLMMAATNGHASLVANLVKAGCDVNLQNGEGNTALLSAVSRGHAEAVDVLLKSGKCDLKERRHSSSLMNTVRKPYDVVEHLFRNTAHTVNRMTDPILIVASARGHTDIVVSLIQFGCDVDITGKFLKTALHHAARCGHVDTTKSLLDAGANMNLQDNMGHTPLLLAAAKGFLRRYRDVMTLLIESGCEVSMVDVHGRNVFHVAAAHGCADIINLLFCRGESTAAEAPTFRGGTPLLTAVRSHRLNVVKIFVAYNCNVNGSFFFQNFKRSLLWFPLHDGFKDVAMVLIAAGAEMQSIVQWRRGRHNFTWLHPSIQGDAIFVRWLLDLLVQPRPLAELCRIKIRRHLSHNIRREVAQLPLPPGLHDVILLREELMGGDSFDSARSQTAN